mmetsp:Transcript_77357/g.234524  ORF Transcript_77357/g.234524 Transcript_77357/m.234524 type:complete len:353 (+) Transcript_77357:392-1450(+)
MVRAIGPVHLEEAQVLDRLHVVHRLLEQCELDATDGELENSVGDALPALDKLGSREDHLLRTLLPEPLARAGDVAEDRALQELLGHRQVVRKDRAEGRYVCNEPVKTHVQVHLKLYRIHSHGLEGGETPHGGIRSRQALDGLRPQGLLREPLAAGHAQSADLATHQAAALMAAVAEPQPCGKGLHLRQARALQELVSRQGSLVALPQLAIRVHGRLEGIQVGLVHEDTGLAGLVAIGRVEAGPVQGTGQLRLLCPLHGTHGQQGAAAGSLLGLALLRPGVHAEVLGVGSVGSAAVTVLGRAGFGRQRRIDVGVVVALGDAAQHAVAEPAAELLVVHRRRTHKLQELTVLFHR